MGASNVYSADEQIEQIAFYWFNLHDGRPTAYDPHSRPQSRPVLRPGRRQPHSQARRTPGPVGGGTPRVRNRHQPRATVARPDNGRQRPLRRRRDDARPAGGFNRSRLARQGGRAARRSGRDRLAGAGSVAGQAVAPASRLPGIAVRSACREVGRAGDAAPLRYDHRRKAGILRASVVRGHRRDRP